MNKIKKLIIPAAGYGTRFLPWTKSAPKEMVPIINKPVIDYVVSEAIQAGIEEILIITSSHKSALISYFDENHDLNRSLHDRHKDKLLEATLAVTNNKQIHFTFQYEQKGLGHSILYAEQFVNNEPFAVLLGDDIVFGQPSALQQCLDAYHKYQATIIGVQPVPEEIVDQYGILKIKDDPSLKANVKLIDRLVEKPKSSKGLSNLAILGRYILQPDFFSYLKKTQPGVGNEIQITDALNTYSKNNNVYACVFSGERFDIGNPKGMLAANIYLGLQTAEYKDIILKTVDKYHHKK